MDEQQEYQSRITQQTATPQSPPPNYLVWAVLTTIFCCLPFGIISLIYAAQVNSKWQSGDMTGADIASKNAKIWAWVAFAVGVSGFLIWFILSMFGIITGIGFEALESLEM